MKDNVIIYVSKNGRVKVDVSINNDDAWMSQDLMAKLYDTTKNNISMHLKNIFDDGELIKEATVKKILTVQKEGNRNVKRNIEYYNLDAIIAVGYRINSKKATEFRIWATRVLKEYMIKGFALDDERLKNNGESPYFEELLARIRDIRSSEKIFWRKVLDIYWTESQFEDSPIKVWLVSHAGSLVNYSIVNKNERRINLYVVRPVIVLDKSGLTIS